MPLFTFDWSSLSNGASWPSAQWDVHPSANWHSDFTVDVQGERGRMARGSADGVAAAWINGVTLDDGIIEVDIEPNAATGERANIICFRQSGSIMADWPVWRETGYLINIAAPGWNDGGIELERRDSFTTVAIIAANTNFTMPAANTRFRIVLDGSLIEVYAFTPGGSPTESDLILSHTDSTYTDGQIGIGTATFVGSGAEARFNNVLVDDLPEDEVAAEIEPDPADALADAPVPTVATVVSTTITPPVASADADAPLPTIGAEVVGVISPQPATATADAPAPDVSVVRQPTTSVPVAEATADAPTPDVSTVLAPVIQPMAADADASAPLPGITTVEQAAVRIQYRVKGTIDWFDAAFVPIDREESIQTGLDPDTTYERRVRAELGEMVSQWTPIVEVTTLEDPGVVVIQPQPADAIADAPLPVVIALTPGATINPPAADATADAPIPTIILDGVVIISPPPADADADAPAPSVAIIIPPDAPIILPSGTWFTVRLYEPLTASNGNLEPLDEFHFEGARTLLQITTERPSGFGTATVGIEMLGNEPLYRPIALAKPVRTLRPWAHVEILAGLTVIWEGQVAQPRMTASGDIIGFMAHGYWSAFNDSELTDLGPAELTTGQIADLARRRVAPYIRMGNDEQVVDPGVRRSLTEFDGSAGGTVIDAINRMGDAAGNPIDVMFWHGRTMWILPRIPPEVADHRLALGPHVEPDVDWMELVGAFRTRYTDETGTEQTTDWREDPTFVERYGRQRRRTLNGGRINRAAADQVARVALEQHKRERLSFTVTLDSNEGLPGVDGGHTPPWLITAQDSVEVLDRGNMLVMASSYDSMRGAATLDIAEHRADAERMLRHMQDQQELLSQGINPLTGARS